MEAWTTFLEREREKNGCFYSIPLPRTVFQASTVYIHTSREALGIEHHLKVPLNNIFLNIFPISKLVDSLKYSPDWSL